MLENTTYTETQKQQFLVTPPPLHARKRKAPENCFRSYIDQVADGFYHASKLVRNTPRKTSDTYFVIKTRATSVGSYRRNYSHRNVALFKTKRDGPTRANIEFVTCSFLELDGSTDNTIKTRRDVFTLTRENNIPTASYVIETSKGNFHVIWNYNNPLPWTEKNESYWTAQQKRLIQLFEQGGFLVDKGASMNPTQNLRNPSQLNAYNFKRRCEVFIHKTFKKTSLRSLYNALNTTSIPNPRPIPASVKLRRYLRANQTFEITLSQLAENLGTSLRTVKTQVSRAVQNGDLRIVARTGNNSGQVRATQYESMLFIEQFPEVQLSSIKTILSGNRGLLAKFKLVGAKKGLRHKTIFALGLFIKHRLGKTACIEAIRAELVQGGRACHVREKEFERILKSIMKNTYSHPFSMAKLRKWGLLEETMCNSKYHAIPLH